MKRSIAFAASFVFALTACSDEAATDDAPVEQGGTAEGDVLGGAISDDMLPLEELTSQSPSAKKSGSSGTSGESEDSE